jgi:hypothetical protein
VYIDYQLQIDDQFFSVLKALLSVGCGGKAPLHSEILRRSNAPILTAESTRKKRVSAFGKVDGRDA